MLRFAAFEWSSCSRAQADQAAAFERSLLDSKLPWTVALEVPGLKVMCAHSAHSASRVRRLPNETGVVLGVVFERNPSDASPRQTTRLGTDENEADAIVATEGRHLVDRYWGRYIAFVVKRDTHTHWVLNAPASDLPCFYGRRAGLRVYCSDIADFFHLDHTPLAINWQYIAMHLVIPRHTAVTALHGVVELKPGMCLRVTPESERLLPHWQAVRYAAQTRIRSYNVAADELKRTCEATVHAWASCYERIFLNLSGGLDSSILAACLRSAPVQPEVIALNYYAKGVEADERGFARQTAGRCGFRLVEIERPEGTSLRRLFALPATPRPGSYVMSVDHADSEQQLARDLDASAIFSGHGGDELFFAGAPDFAPADFVYEQGLRTDLLRIIAASARARNLSTWRVMRSALSRGLFTRQWSPTSLALLSRYRQLLNPDLIAAFRRDQWDFHTWPRTTRDAPPGFLQQRFLLEEPIDFYGPLTGFDSPEQVSPLLSQPMLELVARIPSYSFSRHGGDRELARSAFAAQLPSDVLQRSVKGYAEDWLESIFRADRDYFRERIMQGHLLRHGLLNQRAVENVLNGNFATAVESFAEFFHVLEVEAWLQNNVRIGSVHA